MIKKSSKSRLTEKQLGCYPGDTLFEKIARAVCRAGVLPAKELYESWEVARRVRKKIKGGRVIDLACGHGLLAHILMLLDNRSPEAFCVDYELPKNAGVLSESILDTWPKLKGRIQFLSKPIQDIRLQPDDCVVSAHACGPLTDRVLDLAISSGANVAVLPCCHDIDRSDTGGLEGWIDGPLAVDVTRAARLKAEGYTVFTRLIPEEISPKNRLLVGVRPY